MTFRSIVVNLIANQKIKFIFASFMLYGMDLLLYLIFPLLPQLPVPLIPRLFSIYFPRIKDFWMHAVTHEHTYVYTLEAKTNIELFEQIAFYW